MSPGPRALRKRTTGWAARAVAASSVPAPPADGWCGIVAAPASSSVPLASARRCWAIRSSRFSPHARAGMASPRQLP